MRSRFSVLACSVADALAGYEPSSLAGDDAAGDAEALAQVAKACQAAALRAAARAAECRSHRGPAGEWLGRLTGTSAGVARRQMETAVAAEANPVVKDALVAGRISADQAAAVLDGAQAEPGAARALIRTAEERGLRGVRDQARTLRLEREDPLVLHQRQHQLAEFTHWVDHDGMVAGRFRLPPEIGAPIVTRLEREADRIYRAAPRAQRHTRSHGAFMAGAFAATVNGEAKSGKGRIDLVLVADHDHFLGLTGTGRSHIVGVGPLPITTIRELAAGAFLKGVMVEGSDVTRVRHFGRAIPAVLETAIRLGPDLDGIACVDCGNRHGIEIDHVDPVANGGATSRSNLRPRCRPCHRAKTERDRTAGLLCGANHATKTGAPP